MRRLISLFLLFNIVGIAYAPIKTTNIYKEKDEKIMDFLPKKMVIIGLTDNIKARNTFEKEMKERLMAYQINAYQSAIISPVIFTTIEKAEEELNSLITIISKKGYDGFMITAVTGVEEKREDTEGYFGVYKVYHLETDIYTINKKEISLSWGMCLDIYDYQLVELQIEDYVDAIIFQMQYEQILPVRNTTQELFITN
ncbi:hypothetical protein [Aquimarina sp. 2304DJ70-9]|uniref:hypothetical protein n=1 Tax=Aquimarina penaris TaxID=3231044 RepID=UPI003463457A